MRKALLIKTPEGWRLKISMSSEGDDLDLMFKIKSLPHWRYSKSEKAWFIPVRKDIIEKLLEWNVAIQEEAIRMVEVKQESKLIENIPKTLYPFQKEGVNFIETKGGRALIADEMGLGKTIQALAWLHIRPDVRPVLIIVPASLKLNWKREIEKWLPEEEVEVLSGTETHQITKNIVIINYDILYPWMNQLQIYSPSVIITDECHFYKSNKAKRTKVIKILAKKVPHFIALSGTPVINRPIEIYNAIKIINPSLFPNEWHFVHRYCNAKYNGFGWDFNGASNTKELHKVLINTIMIRRLKEDVLSQLPNKIRSFIPIELSNPEVYKKAEHQFINYLRQTKGDEAAKKALKAQAFVKIEVLKQIAVEGKMLSIIQWIRDFLEVENKLVVFTVHRKIIEALMEEFKGCAVKIDGSVSPNQRQKVVDEFQNNPNVKLFIGNLRAAGVGLTLTASSNVAIIELPWTPGELMQAEDRCHRIGQTKSVNIYYLLAMDTIEERIAKLIDNKRKILDEVLDGKDVEKESLLMELIKSYTPEE